MAMCLRKLESNFFPGHFPEEYLWDIILTSTLTNDQISLAREVASKQLNFFVNSVQNKNHIFSNTDQKFINLNLKSFRKINLSPALE